MGALERALLRTNDLIDQTLQTARVASGIEIRREPTTMRAVLDDAGERAIIEIEDACGGLEPGKVEAAFAPFVRLDSDQTGFGLGSRSPSKPSTPTAARSGSRTSRGRAASSSSTSRRPSMRDTAAGSDRRCQAETPIMSERTLLLGAQNPA